MGDIKDLCVLVTFLNISGKKKKKVMALLYGNHQHHATQKDVNACYLPKNTHNTNSVSNNNNLPISQHNAHGHDFKSPTIT